MADGSGSGDAPGGPILEPATRTTVVAEASERHGSGPVLFLFLDGVGLGDDDPGRNPLAAAAMPQLRDLLGGPLVLTTPSRRAPELTFGPLDAGLQYAGLPQSATGQTTLLTGLNAADLMHGHYGPWPGPTLRRVLEKDTLFQAAGGRAALANVYPPDYFRALESRRMRPNAPVIAARGAGVVLRELSDYREGNAVPADLTGVYFASLVAGVPAIAAEAAGRRLAALAGRHRFTFFDLWLTDRFGHAQAQREAVELLQRLDAFLAGLLPDLGRVTLVMTSDHGNLEDLSTSRHTRNPVPLLVVGPGAPAFSGATGLIDVAPAIRSLWRSA